MKRFMKSVFALLLALTVVMSLPITAFATGGQVTYDENDDQEFIFEPGSSYSLTDLFTNFKDVMPGDELTDTVTIRNSTGRRVQIRVYMRALGAHEDSEEFLSQLNLSVKKKNGSVIFDDPANETGDLTDWTYIATLDPKKTTTLELTLEVPITLGNEFQDTVGKLDWQFKVEEIPLKDDTPKTGDMILYAAVICAVSAAAIVVLFVLRKKGKKD